MSVSTCMHIPSPQAQTLTISIYSQTLTICINTLVKTCGLCGPQQIYLCNKMSTLKEGNMEYIRITNLVRIRGTHFQRYRLGSSSNCFAVDDLEILQWCHLRCHRWVLEEKMWHSPGEPFTVVVLLSNEIKCMFLVAFSYHFPLQVWQKV